MRAILLLLLAGPVFAQDVPYYPRTMDLDQDRGALNQNMRDLADRNRNLVHDSGVPQNTCFADDTFCVDTANYRVGIGAEYPAVGLDVRKPTEFHSQVTFQGAAGSSAVVFNASATFNAGIFGNTAVWSSATIAAGTTFTNTYLGPCIATVTVMFPTSGVAVAHYSGSVAGTGVTQLKLTLLLDGGFLSDLDGTYGVETTYHSANDADTNGSFSRLIPVTSGTHSFCLGGYVNAGTGKVGCATAGHENTPQFYVESLR